MGKQKEKSPLHFDTSFHLSFLMPKYWATWLILLISFLIYLLPARRVDKIANKLGDFAKKSNKKRLKIASKNIELCFPGFTEHEKEKILREHFRAQARSVLHYGLIMWGSKRTLQKRIKLHGQELIEQSKQQGREAIIMVVHTVGLEAAVNTLSFHNQITGPFKSMRNELLNYIVAKARIRFGTLIYTREAGLRPIIKDVKKGCVMCYLPDEDLGPEKSIFTPLFGIKKATIPVLGRLAKSCNADVFPCVSCYDEKDAKYNVHVLPKLENFPVGEDEQDTLEMNRAIENLITKCPEQYFWTLRIFKTRPEGEKKFY